MSLYKAGSSLSCPFKKHSYRTRVKLSLPSTRSTSTRTSTWAPTSTTTSPSLTSTKVTGLSTFQRFIPKINVCSNLPRDC